MTNHAFKELDRLHLPLTMTTCHAQKTSYEIYPSCEY